MPWTRQAITPLHLPFGEDGLTHDPGLVVEVEPIRAIEDCAIWGFAPLTDHARRDVPPLVRKAWHVRRVGQADPFAIVVKMRPHRLQGRIMSASPERATIERRTDRLLVVMPDLVLTAPGVDPGSAYARLADWMEGTRDRPRRRLRPAKAPADDLAAISTLALDGPRR